MPKLGSLKKSLPRMFHFLLLLSRDRKKEWDKRVNDDDHDDEEDSTSLNKIWIVIGDKTPSNR